jgi:MATE family multidrug resistance protein
MTMSVFAEEAWRVLRFALPQMAILYAQVVVNSITLAFVGNYDPAPEDIAGTALGNTYYQVTGLSVGIGLGIQLGAFCAQNYGRGAAEENGTFFWKCVRAQAGAFVFAVAAGISSAHVLRALGQPEDVITPASLYILVQLLSLPGAWGTFALNSTLASQQHLMPGVVATIAGNIVNFSLTWWLFAVADVGYLGVAWGNAAGQTVNFLLLVLYVMMTKNQATVWRLPPAEKTNGNITLGFYLRAAFPGAFSLWAEWWAACILGVLAGLLPGGDASVAANGILFACLSVFYMTFVGVQMATQQRMGELVGARDVSRIPSSVFSAATVALVLSIAVSAMLQVFGADLLDLYTHDPAIIAQAVGANLGMVLSIPPYAVMMCLLGALRSAGLQGWGTGALVVSFYVFGIPFGAYAGFAIGMGWGLLGIWSGNVVSLSLAAISMGVKMCTVEWSSVVEEAMAYEGSKEELDLKTNLLEPPDEKLGNLSAPLLPNKLGGA